MLAEQGLDASARDAFADEIARALTKPAATLRRFRRDPKLPAVRCVEDLFPETSIFKAAISIKETVEEETKISLQEDTKSLERPLARYG